MEYTKNYQLPTWAEEDRIQRTDFNDMTAKIETALGGHDEAMAELGVALTRKGNCQIYTTTYEGAGVSGPENPCTVTFPAPPILLFVVDTVKGSMICGGRGGSYLASPDGELRNNASWSGNTVSWYANVSAPQYNSSGKTYLALAFVMMDE